MFYRECVCEKVQFSRKHQYFLADNQILIVYNVTREAVVAICVIRMNVQKLSGPSPL